MRVPPFSSAQQSCKLVSGVSERRKLLNMRFIILTLVVFFIAIAGLIACNSNEAFRSQTPKTAAPPTKPPPPPADNARRITAAELHAVWQKGEVVIIDTRPESA